MTTTPRGIFSPDDSDDWDLTVDLAALALSADAAIGNATIATSGLESAIPASATNGATYFATDTNTLWRRKSGIWVVEDKDLRSWTSGVTGLTLGNGTLTTRYVRKGAVIEFFIELLSGSTTVATGPLIFNFPEAPESSTIHRNLGEGLLRFTGGTASYMVHPRQAGASTFSIATIDPGTSAILPGANVSSTWPTASAWSGATIRPSIYLHGTYLTNP